LGPTIRSAMSVSSSLPKVMMSLSPIDYKTRLSLTSPIYGSAEIKSFTLVINSFPEFSAL
jgi:hypothetical protein